MSDELYDLDLTGVGVTPEKGIATIVTVECQEKSSAEGAKWNKDGTSTVEYDVWKQVPNELKRLHITMSIPEVAGYVWHDLYFSPKALRFTKDFLTAAGVSITPQGFNPFEMLGKTVGYSGVNEDSGEYGIQFKFKNFFRA